MKALLIFFCFCLLNSCISKIENDNSLKINYGHNIVVLADLSNRVQQIKSINDTTIIFSIIDKLKPLIEKSIDLNIDDKFNFYSINQVCVDRMSNSEDKRNFDIDMTDFNKNELKISRYLYGKIKQDYDYDISSIKTSIKKVYDFNSKSKILGADIWHYFNDELNSNIIDTTSTPGSFRDSHYINKKKNKVILLTDGYIEAGKYENNAAMHDKENQNRTMYLSGNLISKFRNDFHKSPYKNIQAFFKEEKYGLIPLQNSLISEVELLVLEIDDRTMKNGVTTVFPTDSKIIKLFWSTWLEESGLDQNNFQIHNTFRNQQELDLILNNFLSK